MSPIVEKGGKAGSTNYRLISFICFLCKVLEYIVASNLSKHFTELVHGIQRDAAYLAD